EAQVIDEGLDFGLGGEGLAGSARDGGDQPATEIIRGQRYRKRSAGAPEADTLHGLVPVALSLSCAPAAACDSQPSAMRTDGATSSTRSKRLTFRISAT